MNTLDLEKLPDYLRAQRWFAGKAAPIKNIMLVDSVDLSAEVAPGVLLAVVQVTYELGLPERYLIPVKLNDGGGFEDALETTSAAPYLLKLMREGGRVGTGSAILHGELVGTEGTALIGPMKSEPAVRRLNVEQTNTSIVFDERVILKVIRKLDGGRNLELEVGRFLATRTQFRATPTLLGSVDLEGPAAATIALAHRYIVSSGDAWVGLTEILKTKRALDASQLSDIEAMGKCVAQLHLALASDKEDPAFAPEPILQEDLQRWSASIIGELGVTLAQATPKFPELSDRRDALVERAQQLARAKPSGLKIRQHGDLHLGQMLRGPDGWLIIDFEGEPGRAFEVRREKHTPLRDVAGMLRSFGYAAASVDLPLEQCRAAIRASRESFLKGYFAAMGDNSVLPETEARAALLDALELEKALYEIRYELQMRPDWAHIPVASLMPSKVTP